MFDSLIGFVLVIVPCLFVYIVFYGKEPTVRLLALACFLGFAGLMYFVSGASFDTSAKERIDALERRVERLEYRNSLKDAEVQRRVEELLKK